MNEELNKMLAKIVVETPPTAQIAIPEIGPGQVWFPRYSQEMKELLKVTPLLQKCRPVYIHTINGNCVTCFKVKTLHSSISIMDDHAKVNEVVFRDPAREIRVIECADVLTMHTNDFMSETAQYLYTVDNDVQMLATLTYAVAMDIPILVTETINGRLNEYYKMLKDGPTPDVSANAKAVGTHTRQSSIDKFTKKWSEKLIKSTEENQGIDQLSELDVLIESSSGDSEDVSESKPAEDKPPKKATTTETAPKSKSASTKEKKNAQAKDPSHINEQRELVSKISVYISHIPETLKFTTKGAFTESHDGYIDTDGTIVIAASIHKALYSQMCSEGIIPNADKLGYYGYRSLLMKAGVCRDRIGTVMGKDGREKKLTLTCFSVKPANA